MQVVVYKITIDSGGKEMKKKLLLWAVLTCCVTGFMFGQSDQSEPTLGGGV